MSAPSCGWPPTRMNSHAAIECAARRCAAGSASTKRTDSCRLLASEVARILTRQPRDLREAADLLAYWASERQVPFPNAHFRWNVAVMSFAEATGDQSTARDAAWRALDLAGRGPVFSRHKDVGVVRADRHTRSSGESPTELGCFTSIAIRPRRRGCQRATAQTNDTRRARSSVVDLWMGEALSTLGPFPVHTLVQVVLYSIAPEAVSIGAEASNIEGEGLWPRSSAGLLACPRRAHRSIGSRRVGADPEKTAESSRPRKSADTGRHGSGRIEAHRVQIPPSPPENVSSAPLPAGLNCVWDPLENCCRPSAAVHAHGRIRDGLMGAANAIRRSSAPVRIGSLYGQTRTLRPSKLTMSPSCNCRPRRRSTSPFTST